MTADRIIFSRGRAGDLEAHLRLEGVEAALHVLRQRSGIVAVVGPHSAEEVQNYFRRIRNYPMFAYSAVGNHGHDLSDLLYHRYIGRMKILRRIMAFMTSHVTMSDADLSSHIIDSRMLWPNISLEDYLANSYINSRKKPDGSEQEISEFFAHVNELFIPDPVVLRRYYGGWNGEQCILVSKALSVGHPLVFVTDRDDLSAAADEILYTPPVTTRHVFEAINSEFHVPMDVVARNYKLWRASRFRRSRVKSIDLDEVASSHSLAEFTNFLLEAVAEGVEDSEGPPTIPNRIVAPLMFREQPDHIGLDHVAVNGITRNVAVGGIRALKNLTQDLKDSGVLANAVVAINPCLDRVVTILEKIESTDPIEEADIVEFGVEFSYLESRIINAQDKLSKDTMEFVLSYTGEGQNLLERFEPWQTYKAEGGGFSDGLGVVNRDIAAASIRLLRAAAADGLLDPSAMTRVNDAVETADIDAPLKRASLAATTQNLGAAVGRSALKGVARHTSAVAKEVGEETRKKFSEAAAEFIQKNSVDLAKLAAAGSGRWLGAFLKTFLGD